MSIRGGKDFTQVVERSLPDWQPEREREIEESGVKMNSADHAKKRNSILRKM